MNIAQSRLQGAYYHADVIYLLTYIAGSKEACSTPNKANGNLVPGKNSSHLSFLTIF